VIEAYRTIEIEVERNDGSIMEVKVPFTVELLHKVEETLKRTTGRVWFVFERSDKSIIEAYEEFCRPHFTEDIDWSQVQPTFAALFFSNVKDALLNSINAYTASTQLTETPPEPMGEGTTTDGL
jgi:hypothetical protein